MAKEKKTEITFDKLSNLNLDIPTNIEQGRGEEAVLKKPAKKATIKTSFKIEKDIHLALKQYCLIQGKEMATVAFEEIIKPFLEKEGYYPPRKK